MHMMSLVTLRAILIVTEMRLFTQEITTEM